MAKLRLPLIALGAAATFMVSAAQAEVTHGQLMASTCFACHGDQGMSTGTIPSIGDWDKDDLAEAMHAFRADERMSTVMGRHAKGYTDEEIEALAEYIGGLN
ncbi:MAG: c-type cytochrome [Pseudomonadota bacterium]